MSTPTPDGQPAARPFPLLASDPPKVGDYWIDARLTAAASGVAYLGHDPVNTSAIVILLSEGAAGDAAARDRFAGLINQLHIDTVLARGGHGQDDGRLAVRFRPDTDDPAVGDELPDTPWVALAYDASAASVAEAQRILDDVALIGVAAQGRPTGPDYRLHWIDQVRPGIAKLWPLPWPGRHDRAGWGSILASWLLMILLCALAVLIAILLFQQAPTQAPRPPVPTTGSPNATVTVSSSASPSPSPSPSSSSPSSASPSPSPGASSPSGSAGSPSPNSRL
ncbi:hypothetical protein [Propionicimonas paludicola]|nr:hypothetical protein [Propionicimonas paludicola]